MRPAEKAWRIPAWLENKRIDDELLSRAYEETPNVCRVALKTAIAATHFYFGSPLKGSGSAACGSLFTWKRRERPIPWSAVFVPANYAAAAMVTASALLPLLAGVENRLWFMYGSKPHANQLVALELCGQEDNFLLEAEDIPRLMGELPSACRCLFLQERHPTSHTCRTLNSSPRALLADKTSFREGVLHFALGTTPVVTEPAGESRWDVIYASHSFSQNAGEELTADLWLGPGLECFWLFPQLTPDFFLEKRTEVSMDDATVSW